MFEGLDREATLELRRDLFYCFMLSMYVSVRGSVRSSKSFRTVGASRMSADWRIWLLGVGKESVDA